MSAFFAPIASASSTWVCPSTTGAPVTDDPGLSPRSPNIVVGPVFVTVEPPNTEKLAAVPSPTLAGEAMAVLASTRLATSAASTKSPAWG
ncbi:MAG TPA: hypothetical protein VGN13_06815 [Solirubrobacteraceae bacterium]